MCAFSYTELNTQVYVALPPAHTPALIRTAREGKHLFIPISRESWEGSHVTACAGRLQTHA